MKDLMIDIETLGNCQNAVILSISAVQFDVETGWTGSEFHIDIDIDSCLDHGLKVTGSTVLWWLANDKNARENVINANRVSLFDALLNFDRWIVEVFPGNDCRPWGNSARFDLGILQSAFDACKLQLPWKFYNELDVRTLVFFNPDIKANEPFSGTKHFGLDDCKHQIKYCSKIHQSLMAVKV